MALTTERKAESSKNMGHERTNFSRETVGTGQLKWEGKCGNLTSAFVIRGVTVFSLAGGGTRTIAVGREAPVRGKESACLFPGIPA